MIKRKGLAFKTFVFTYVIITLVVTISFGILYYMLPGYYTWEKTRSLERNANELVLRLNMAQNEEECAQHIVDFSNRNNSIVLAFNEENTILPFLSSPLLLMDARDRIGVAFHYIEAETDTEPSLSNRKTIFRSTLVGNPTDNAQVENNIAHIQNDTGGALFIQESTQSAVVSKVLKNDWINYIAISSTLQPIDEAKSVVISLIPYLLVLDFLIALIAAYAFAHNLTKPILQISHTTTLMQKMHPDILSNIRTSDELGQLSENLDNLYQNLCENIQNLKTEMDKTARLEQSKTDFMRAAGHELKTPISALNGMIEGMIDNVGIYKNREKYLDESKNQVMKLAKLVHEILTASQLDQAEETIVWEEINIRSIMEEALSTYSILFENKNLCIQQDIFDFYYTTDAHMLLMALSNLIANAVHYTAPGHTIQITLQKEATQAILSIENECPPIDEELLSKLCEPFFTLNYSRNKTESGTGLGLYIVKKNLEILKLPFTIQNTSSGLRCSIQMPISKTVGP